MSIHTKKQSIDKQIDKSDILSILESIETMIKVCQKVHNRYTKSALLLSITTEAEMLLLKLRKMNERWKTHLPFKEATNVNFYAWHKKIEMMSKAVEGDESARDSEYSLVENCPSKHYLLDIYECLDESPSHNGGIPHFADTDVNNFIIEQGRIRSKLSRKWGEYRIKFSSLVHEELNEELGDVLRPISLGQNDIQRTCQTVLSELSIALYDLFNAPWGRISQEQFERLAYRVIGEDEYGGPKAKIDVLHDMTEAKNDTPEDQWEARREDEIRVAIELIRDMKLESKVFTYLGRDKTMFDNPAGLGRFLWSVRNNISISDLSNLIELLYQIAYLSKDREQQIANEAKSNQQTQQSEPKGADAIYNKRKTTKMQTPPLPKFFNEKLAANETAVDCFYEILHHCGFFIGRPLLPAEKKDPETRCYEGWKWDYLREAFIKLGFFKADSSKRGFALYLADVFPYLTATNVQRSFNSRNAYVDSNAKQRIINEMVEEFDEVVDLM